MLWGWSTKSSLLQNECLIAENTILRAHLPGRLRLTDPQRSTFVGNWQAARPPGTRGSRRRRQAGTILAWYRRLIAHKFDGSRHRAGPGRPSVAAVVVELIVRMARENPGWGYDRIVGALSNLGYTVCDQTVGNILRRHGIAPAPKRSQMTTWKDFIAAHMAVLGGIDFFSVEVLTWRGLATHYVLFFIQLESRRVNLAGSTKHPDAVWMEQMARNAIDPKAGQLRSQRYVLHDRDTKFCATFRATWNQKG
jgi:putative transposase